MNFNTMLTRLGMDPDNFINRENEPIKTEEGFIYEVYQRTDIRHCPHCGSQSAHIQDYDWIEINCSETDYIRDILRIRKVRFKCTECHKTFTPSVQGIQRYSKISSQTLQLILNDFSKMMSFSQIAERYHLTPARILQIFDENVPYVPRKPLPRTLCIDEIKFDEEYDQKYCCVLYDFENRQIVDIIKNRQLPYLEEYFSLIPQKERDRVKFFVSDMHDPYATVARKYLKSATHIIDMFHVVRQLTQAISKIRIEVMKTQPKNSIYYRFMKKHWKLFLCRKEDIPDKFYSPKGIISSYHFTDLVFSCIKLNRDLLSAYNILQDLFHYSEKRNYNDALNFISYISDRLVSSNHSLLIPVGKTYDKWKFGIASAFSRSQNSSRITNAIAESINNHLKTILKFAYGYHNFPRFRNRALLILSYKKTR